MAGACTAGLSTLCGLAWWSGDRGKQRLVAQAMLPALVIWTGQQWQTTLTSTAVQWTPYTAMLTVPTTIQLVWATINALGPDTPSQLREEPRRTECRAEQQRERGRQRRQGRVRIE